MRIAQLISAQIAGIACILGLAVDAPAQTQAAPQSPEAAQGAPARQPVAADSVAVPEAPPEPTGGDAMPDPGNTPPVTPTTGAPREPVLAVGSPALRQRCEQAIAEDEEWRTELKENLAHRLFEAPQNARDEALRDMVRLEAHKAETERLARNEKHVIYAYAALWILTALFVAFMFVRQRSLSDEIARLKRELEKAI